MYLCPEAGANTWYVEASKRELLLHLQSCLCSDCSGRNIYLEGAGVMVLEPLLT